MRTIVVTGSESFIGTALKPECRARGIRWIGVDAAPSPDPGHVVMDIRDPDIERAIPAQADALIHLAAISRDQDCRQDPRLAFEVNVGGTLNLIQAVQRRRVKQLIFASSEWVYGEVPNAATQTEDTVIEVSRLSSDYALTKLVGEQVLAIAHQRGLCPVTVLRFGIVYGPRPSANWSAVEMLFHAVRTQETVEVKGSLRTARRFIHVSDIARGILASLGRTGYQVFNLSGDTLITLQDIIEESAALLHQHPQVAERNPGSVSIRNPDNRKAREVLGWAPQVSLREGLVSLLPMLSEVEDGARTHR